MGLQVKLMTLGHDIPVYLQQYRNSIKVSENMRGYFVLLFIFVKYKIKYT